MTVNREELEAKAHARQHRADQEKTRKPEDAKCADIERFDGSPTKLMPFIEELENYFELKPKSFSRDDHERKIRYVSTRLMDTTAQ